MINNIEEYMSQLKAELSGSDAATIQDALADAEEYLRTALNGFNESESDISEAEALASIIEKYGEPEEVAAAYREIEQYTLPAFGKTGYRKKETPIAAAEVEEPEEPVVKDTRPFYARFFGIVAEPRAWGALFYLLFSLCTGIIYFTWVVVGVSTSVSLLILIVGLPIAAFFILSVWGISLAEGRIVESLLGVRMPRRPLYYRKNMGWWPRLKAMFTDKHTWLTIVYMVLQFPLGIFYFCLFVILIAFSLWGIAIPVLQLAFDIPVSQNFGVYYYLYNWELPLVFIVGVLLFFSTMHLAKLFGKLHGRLAKLMLVRM